MKRFLLSMAALLTIVGCAQQEDLASADLGAATAPEFGVGIESSRVAIAEDGETYKLSWTADDRVSVFFNTGGNSEYKFMGNTGDASGIIKAVNAAEGEALANCYAIYPYAEDNSLEGDVLSFTLPAEQQYAEGTFAVGANTMVAKAVSEEDANFSFSNVCGYLRLKVYGEATIKSIKVEGKNNEIIAGAATYNMTEEALAISGEGKAITLNCGEGVALGATEAQAKSFWVVVPPMAFDEGLKVTLTDTEGKQETKELGTPFTVERNKVHDGVIAFNATPVVIDPNLLFDAQFNENGTATDGGKFGMTIQRMVDYVGETPNMSTAYDSKIQRNVVTFTHTPSNPDESPALEDREPTSIDSYYLVDFSENPEFEAAITDGYTFEILTYRIQPKDVNCWSFAFSFGSVDTKNNSAWGMFHNSRGNSWAPGWQVFGNLKSGGPRHWVEPAMEQYEHVIVSCDAEGNNTGYTNGVLRYTGKVPLNLQEDHKCFAIGGVPLYGGLCREYYGKIAMVRIYDAPMTAQEAMARCNELNLPARYDVALDIDLSNGSVSDASANKMPIKVVGEPTVDDGVLTLSNPAGAANQYIVADASANWADLWGKFSFGGFTVETVLARTSADAEGAPFSIGATGDDLRGYRLQALAGDNHYYKSWSWQNVQMTDEAGLHTAVAELGKFYHVVARYDGLGAGCWSIYVNGEFIAEQKQNGSWGLAMNQPFTSQLFGIGAVPKGAYDTVTGALGFDGKIAVARLYSNNLPEYAIRARYNELKPTIDALNAK